MFRELFQYVLIMLIVGGPFVAWGLWDHKKEVEERKLKKRHNEIVRKLREGYHE